MNTTDSVSPPAPHKLGLSLLVALVVGSIIGSGIFGLPQNMAAGAGAGAGAGAIVIGWTVTVLELPDEEASATDRHDFINAYEANG